MAEALEAWTGLILAGGTGSRLYPLTTPINKHLLPVYDKPMIFYPLTTLMMGGLRDFVLVTTPTAAPMFEALLGDGARWGITMRYAIQERPGGIAEGFRVARSYLEGRRIALILGDNIFYGSGLGQLVRKAAIETRGATVFSYEVNDPSSFGIVTLDEAGRPLTIEEKPQQPASRLAVTGLYLYAPDVLDVAGALRPSARGELEITDVNRRYLEEDRLAVQPLGRGVAWLDGGTCGDLFEAGQFVKVLEDRTGLKIACPEEIAVRQGWIGAEAFAALVESMPTSTYRDYLDRLRKERERAAGVTVR